MYNKHTIPVVIFPEPSWVQGRATLQYTLTYCRHCSMLLPRTHDGSGNITTGIDANIFKIFKI